MGALGGARWLGRAHAAALPAAPRPPQLQALSLAPCPEGGQGKC